MAETFPPLSKNSKLASYSFLRGEVRRVLFDGRKRALDYLKSESNKTCWDVGKLVEAHIQITNPSEKGRAAYGDQTIKNLAEDLAENPTYLYTGWRLAKSYPIFLPAEKLSLSHYEHLLTVEDPRKRKALAERAEKHRWSKRKLALEIQKSKSKVKEAFSPSSKKLIPKHGRVHTYSVFAEEGKLVLDLGFRKYEDLTPSVARRLKAGDIVEVVPGQKIKKLKGVKPSELYTYQAQLQKLIDGDTLRIKIYLTKTGWISEKLRLRGVDCAELNTEEGKVAKKFVAETLEKITTITISTTQHPDKWDRYLVDVFLTEKNGNEIFLNHLLLETGHAKRVATYRDSDWEKE